MTGEKDPNILNVQIPNAELNGLTEEKKYIRFRRQPTRHRATSGSNLIIQIR